MAAETSQENKIDLLEVLLAPLKGLRGLLSATSRHNTRVCRIEYLRGLTDEQLSRRGLRREDIVRHVYRGATSS